MKFSLKKNAKEFILVVIHIPCSTLVDKNLPLTPEFVVKVLNVEHGVHRRVFESFSLAERGKKRKRKKKKKVRG